MDSHDQLRVVTTHPNRYAEMRTAGGSQFHDDERFSVVRASIPAHRSGFVDQALGFRHFARAAWEAALAFKPDLVVATSSRLATAALGAAVARRNGAKLYLDLRDIFTETLADVVSTGPMRTLIPLFSRVEHWALRRADRINIVSPAFADYFGPIVGHREFSTFTNGVDSLFLEAIPPGLNRDSAQRIVMVAGNMGDGQGLHRIIPQVAERLEGTGLTFRLIGGGGRRPELENALEQSDAGRFAEIRDPIPREELIEQYHEASVLFLHLNDLRAFDRVLPSKIFEYAATGLPIVAGVKGYARRFLDENVVGAFTFDPCDVDGCLAALKASAAGPPRYDRTKFVERYARCNIMKQMAREILLHGQIS
nr:glycosyltransferase [Sphingomicrobium lutaoense]